MVRMERALTRMNAAQPSRNIADIAAHKKFPHVRARRGDIYAARVDRALLASQHVPGRSQEIREAVEDGDQEHVHGSNVPCAQMRGRCFADLRHVVIFARFRPGAHHAFPWHRPTPYPRGPHIKQSLSKDRATSLPESAGVRRASCHQFDRFCSQISAVFCG